MPTNAIAASILSLQVLIPAFNHFAEQAELGINLPLNESRVTKSYTGRNRNKPSIMVVFDGQHQFNWESRQNNIGTGYINYYDNSNAVSRLEGRNLLQLTKIKSLISTNEAREIAERFLKKLDFELSKINAGSPRVVQWTYTPETVSSEPVPIPGFVVRWYPAGIKNPHWSEVLITMEVSGITKKVTRFDSSPVAADALTINPGMFATNSSYNNSLKKGRRSQ